MAYMFAHCCTMCGMQPLETNESKDNEIHNELSDHAICRHSGFILSGMESGVVKGAFYLFSTCCLKVPSALGNAPSHAQF